MSDSDNIEKLGNILLRTHKEHKFLMIIATINIHPLPPVYNYATIQARIAMNNFVSFLEKAFGIREICVKTATRSPFFQDKTKKREKNTLGGSRKS
jgi:hypothetical protein